MLEILSNTASEFHPMKACLGKVPPRKDVWKPTQNIGLLQKGSKKLATNQVRRLKRDLENSMAFFWSARVLQLNQRWNTLNSPDILCMMASKLCGGLTEVPLWNSSYLNHILLAIAQFKEPARYVLVNTQLVSMASG